MDNVACKASAFVFSVLLFSSPLFALGEKARDILQASGISGGLVVVIDWREESLLAELARAGPFLIHALIREESKIAEARQAVLELGVGEKVTVEEFTAERLPYIDNLVDLICVLGKRAPSKKELLRVLRPGGVALLREGESWKRLQKPWPPEIDEWTHALHGPDNNAVSKDKIVGPPFHLQWIAEPKASRQHETLASISAVVTAQGRLFSIEDEGPISSVILPAEWFLVARDAFNGIVLWKRKVGPWEDHLRPFRMGPPDISRKIVAIGDRVYATLGYGKALLAINAETGRTIQRYKGTEGTSEIIYSDGVLFLVAGKFQKSDGKKVLQRFRPSRWEVKQKRILAVSADRGRILWEKKDADTSSIMPTTLAAAAGRLFFQTQTHVICLDSSTGKEIWRAARPVATRRPGFSAPTLVVWDDVVLSADRATEKLLEREPGRKHRAGWVDAPLGRLIAFSARNGKELWSADCREGFNAPVDVLVVNGLVWTGELVVSRDPGITRGRDVYTGEVIRRRPPDQAFFNVGMPHHRCFRNKATEKYLILARAGVEFVDLSSGEAIPHHWIRGTCQFGTLPANGLLYVPPHSCACYLQAKLNGFLALAHKTACQGRDSERARLIRGSAFQAAAEAMKNGAYQWPTYRHDNRRSGWTKTKVMPPLKLKWKKRIGGKLSPIVVACGKVLLSSIDNHTVYALERESGSVLWRFTAGGRVDSPPTVSDGFAVFGCADGYIYCLSLTAGKLVWRFRAAPKDLRIVAYGQLESVWPVPGSVLVEKGIVYAVCGRSSYLDSGLVFCKLDLRTGKLLAERRIWSRDPRTGRQPKGAVTGFDLAGALPDILSCDPRSLYLRHLALDRDGRMLKEANPHLFSPTGFLDDTGWHRSYWIFGTRFYTGYRDWFRAGREVPSGKLLVMDENYVYGYGYKARYYYWSRPVEYHLYKVKKKPPLVPAPHPGKRLPAWGRKQVRCEWAREVPIRVRAMVLAGGTLFIAGPPELVNENRVFQRRREQGLLDKLRAQEEALEGKRGGSLLAVSASDGSGVATYKLESPPVWDGMSACGGRLFMATMSGEVLCFEGKKE